MAKKAETAKKKPAAKAAGKKAAKKALSSTARPLGLGQVDQTITKGVGGTRVYIEARG